MVHVWSSVDNLPELVLSSRVYWGSVLSSGFVAGIITHEAISLFPASHFSDHFFMEYFITMLAQHKGCDICKLVRAQ